MAFKINIMKKIFFISFLFISFSSFSQGNLQFNRVVNISYTKDINTGITSIATPTISENKVWKLTSVTIFPENEIGEAYLYDEPANNLLIEFGDIVIFSSIHSNNYLVRFPIWINSGQKELEVHATDSYSSTANRMKIMISAIEFNIVN